MASLNRPSEASGAVPGGMEAAKPACWHRASGQAIICKPRRPCAPWYARPVANK